LLRAVASILTGSIAIRADAIHSVIDLSGVIIGYIGIRIASKPPDEQRAFGHGKAENIASTIIAGLILAAAGTIFYGAIKRLIVGGSVELVTLGIYVTAVAIVINGTISWYSLRIARSADSLALEATAHDMFADVLSSCAVLAGLILVRLTGLNLLDSIAALLVAVLIARTAYLAMKKSLGGLIDVKLPEDEENIIRSSILEHVGELVSFHELRTRKAGKQRYIDLHLVVPKDTSVEEAHRLCDHLEQDIEVKLQSTNVTIHVEPCDEKCDQCPIPTNPCKPEP